jgi:hypothetical protein
MPRVYTKTKSKRGKTYNCSGCGEPIKPGQSYYTWSRRFGYGRGVSYYRHTKCGFPRPTQLSSRKTAQIEEAVLDANQAIGSWSPTLKFEPGDDPVAEVTVEIEHDYGDVSAALEEVSGVARDVGQEYEDGADNMPEQLAYSPVAEAMREAKEACDDYADELERWQPDREEPEIPERIEHETSGEFEVRLQDALDSWAEEVRDSAQEALSEIPEYQG